MEVNSLQFCFYISININMAYNASSKKVSIEKLRVSPSTAANAALNVKGPDPAQQRYNAEVIKSFINDLTLVLSKSHFHYKELLLEEFHTLLTNYKVATISSTDTALSNISDNIEKSESNIISSLSDSYNKVTEKIINDINNINSKVIPENLSNDITDNIIKYAESNIVSALHNILALLNSTNEDIIKVVESGFSKLKENNDNSELLEQFNNLNSQNAEIRKLLTENSSNSEDSNDNNIKDIEKTSGELLEEFTASIKKEFIDNNKSLLKDIKKSILDSSNTVVRRLKNSNKTLLSNSVLKLEKSVSTISSGLYGNKYGKFNTKDSPHAVLSSIKSKFDKSLYIEKDDSQLYNFANRLNKGILANIYTAIKDNKTQNLVNSKSGIKSKYKNKSRKFSKNSTSNNIKFIQNKVKPTALGNTKPNFSVPLLNNNRTLVGTLLRRLPSVIGGTFTKVIKAFIKPVLKFAATAGKIIKTIAGGPVLWILLLLKQPIVIALIAFVSAWIYNKVVLPIMNMWNTYVAPIIDYIKEFYNTHISPFLQPVFDIIGRIGTFFGDVLEMGWKDAGLKLWDYVREKVPVMLEGWLLKGLLKASEIHSRFILPAIKAVQDWFYEKVRYPITKWFYEKIYNPTIRLLNYSKGLYYSAIAIIYRKLGDIMMAIGGLWEDSRKERAAPFYAEANKYEAMGSIPVAPEFNIAEIETPEQYKEKTAKELKEKQDNAKIQQEGLKVLIKENNVEDLKVEQAARKADKTTGPLMSTAVRNNEDAANAQLATASNSTPKTIVDNKPVLAALSAVNEGQKQLAKTIATNNSVSSNTPLYTNNNIIINQQAPRPNYTMAPTYGYSMFNNQQ